MHQSPTSGSTACSELDFPTNTIASVMVRGSQWQTLRETQPGAQAQTTVAFAVFHAIAS